MLSLKCNCSVILVVHHFAFCFVRRNSVCFLPLDKWGQICGLGREGDSEQWAQRAHCIRGQHSRNDKAGSKAAWKDEKDEERAADVKDAVLPEENTAIHKIFKDRTCVQDEGISETKHRWLLSSETQTAAESWRLLNFMVLSHLGLCAYPLKKPLYPANLHPAELWLRNQGMWYCKKI